MLFECPVSHITGQSVAMLEEFAAWKLSGGGDLRRLPAKTGEAICLLESEAIAERNSE